jgi:hypothetical protein
VVVLFAVGTSLLRLRTIASYSFCKTPGGLKFQRTRDIRTVRRYCRNLILRVAQLSVIVTDNARYIPG